MLLHFIAVVLVGFVLTAVIRFYALSRKVLDIPNQRSSHVIPTPRGGGLAIVVAFSLALVVLLFTQRLSVNHFAALSSALLVAVIGFCDDHAHVAARWRLLVHFTAAMLVLWFLGGMPALWLPSPLDQLLQRQSLHLDWLGYALGLPMLVWSLNLFNFMDGTDGIAASEAIFVALGLAGFLYFLDRSLFAVAVSLAAACLGFLSWNWPRAKIFMGDVGSGFLGLLLGVLILMSAQQAAVLLYCGLILFGVFVVDATYTLAIRFASGQKWYDAHCSHCYQRAAKRYGHLPVLIACWAINLGWLLPWAVWVFLHPAYALLGMATAYAPMLVVCYLFKAGRADIAS